MEATQMWAVIVVTVCSATVLQTFMRTVSIRIRRRGNPEEVLARRFAAGEIDEHEYLLMLSVLQETRELTP
jgi:uncharacterized membrane protein